MTADKTMLNFRCPNDLLEAIDQLGQQRYPADNKNGCDRSKTIMDIIRAGITALSDGSVVLPVQADVRRSTETEDLGEKIDSVVEAKTAYLLRRLEELEGKLPA